jgi:hypothetical protein
LFIGFSFFFSVATALTQMMTDFYHVSELRIGLSLKYAATAYFLFAAYMNIPATQAYE